MPLSLYCPHFLTALGGILFFQLSKCRWLPYCVSVSSFAYVFSCISLIQAVIVSALFPTCIDGGWLKRSTGWNQWPLGQVSWLKQRPGFCHTKGKQHFARVRFFLSRAEYNFMETMTGSEIKLFFFHLSPRSSSVSLTSLLNDWALMMATCGISWHDSYWKNNDEIKLNIFKMKR